MRHGDGPPARLFRDFRVCARPHIWSGAPELVPRTSLLPFSVSFESPAPHLPPACHVCLLPPPVTRAMSPRHSDEALVPHCSPLVYPRSSSLGPRPVSDVCPPFPSVFRPGIVITQNPQGAAQLCKSRTSRVPRKSAGPSYWSRDWSATCGERHSAAM